MSRATATSTPRLTHRVAAEAVGTGWLVLLGCGTAVLAGEASASRASPWPSVWPS